MRSIKIILSVFAYGSATIFFLAAIAVLFDRDTGLGTNIFACLTCLAITAGLVKLGKWLIKRPPVVEQQREQVLKPEQQTEAQRLQSTFYELVQKNQGLMTVMQFAMAAEISGKDAKAYLDEQAKQFDAYFEDNEAGTVVYKFPL